MKIFGSILSKVLIIIATLSVTISLSIFPLFSWGLPLQNNIAVIITLLFNQKPFASDFYKQLMNSNNITGYLASGLILFNLTYLIVLVFVKKPSIKAVIAIYMFLMTLVFTAFMLFIYNFFNFTYFQTIPLNNLWIIPLVLSGLNFLAIFWYGLRNLWVNPRKMVTNLLQNNKTTTEKQTNCEDLQNQIKQLKLQLKEIKHVKPRKR